MPHMSCKLFQTLIHFSFSFDPTEQLDTGTQVVYNSSHSESDYLNFRNCFSCHCSDYLRKFTFIKGEALVSRLIWNLETCVKLIITKT